MRNKIMYKILVTLLTASMVYAATVSSSVFTALAQSATLEDVIAEIEALNDRLDGIEGNVTALNLAVASLNDAADKLEGMMYSLSATTATASEIARFDSILDNLSDMINEAWAITISLNATAATKFELNSVKETVDDLEVALDSLSARTQATESYLTGSIELLKILVAIALVLALVAAAAAVAAVYLMRQKNKTPKTG